MSWARERRVRFRRRCSTAGLAGKPLLAELKEMSEILRRVDAVRSLRRVPHGPPIQSLKSTIRNGTSPAARSDLPQGNGPQSGGPLRVARLVIADDIEHWLADEPVAVRRDTPLERAARWTRRHRAGPSRSGSIVAGGKSFRWLPCCLPEQCKIAGTINGASRKIWPRKGTADKEGEWPCLQAQQLTRDNARLVEVERQARDQADSIVNRERRSILSCSRSRKNSATSRRRKSCAASSRLAQPSAA